ncbi:AtpZ/AtpI family protein [Sphingobacterium shayense]|uniref:AtpZ/AtpI family protein n=1 Tax=Sphingobacterium shayense TaxID=626343 RepID=UPI0015526D90|nr:AtpZ/AtpI family protein [Sphingobacterium shayense]NQD72241.1 AtpZ/AtpI family protein [Sphingobacterium shayense]
MEENKKKGQKNKWLIFTSMPFQMGITIYLFYRLGMWLDSYFETTGEWWMKGVTMLGVVASLYQFIRQVNYLNKNE